MNSHNGSFLVLNNPNVDVPFSIETVAVLAKFVHPNHRAYCAHRDELTCRLPVSPSHLDIGAILINV
ncbi:hypothetical protein CEJ46_04810 [Vibrio anguillarum]|nr:hypothetical protein CEJ46_04810 [Vibrio anguillarum]